VRERLRDAESTRGSSERAARVREACEKLRKQACKNCGIGSSCKSLMALSLLHCRTIKPTYKRRKRNYYFISLASEISLELSDVVKTLVHPISLELLEGNPKVYFTMPHEWRRLVFKYLRESCETVLRQCCEILSVARRGCDVVARQL
jgi:hypothetical protein